VQPGFSGTPVWDEKEKGVVGMIVAAEKQLDIRAAFVIPTGMLVEIWPDLSSVVHKRTELADVFQRRRIDNRADRTSKRAFEKTKRLLTSRSNGAELLRLLSALENEVGEGPHASIQTIGELLDEFQRIDKVVYEQLLKEILSDASNVAESARSTVRARLQGIRAVRR
jgi:prophage DNA circulation protein